MSKTPQKSVKTPKARRLKVKNLRGSVKLRRQIKASYKKLPSAWSIFRKSMALIWKQWRLFVGITAVYSIVSLVLIGGLSSVNVADLKSQVNEILSSQANSLWSNLVIFTYMANRSGLVAAGTASAYQTVALLVTSLALIWLIRQVYADFSVKLRVRDGFYKGAYPIVTFTLVMLVVFLQMLPGVAGLFLYNLVTNSIASTLIELVIWGLLAILLVMWSLYMLTSSLFALYIVCLPDMTPMMALRTARNLVRARRWTLIRKILALPLIITLLWAIIIVPIIAYLPAAAGITFSLLSMFSLVVVHTYMYSLYRELL